MKIIGTSRPGYYLVEAGEGELGKIRGLETVRPSGELALKVGDEIDVHRTWDALRALTTKAYIIDKFAEAWTEVRGVLGLPLPAGSIGADILAAHGGRTPPVAGCGCTACKSPAS